MLQPGDGWLAVTTLSFDIAALELFLPLLSGARLVLASRQVAMDGVRLASALAEHDICVMQATPASWRLLLQSGWRGTPGFRILCGGEAMPADLALALRACAGAVWNLYGPTETTIWSTACRLDDGTASASIGRPLDNTQVYVLDRHAQLVAPGVIGEIHIAGAGVARGYLNRPELTAERFLSDPFNPDPRARMYRTGDLGRWRADGSLDYLGRNDFQVKLRGFRIELGEIEACLASCAGVRQAVVVAAADGGGAQRLLAYLVVAEQAPSAVDLRAALLTMLPDYMVPSAFVHLVAFPLTPNGKIDRQALPAPDQAALASRDYLAPQGGMEQAVARIWQEMLGVERVGRHDHFFELGGHSLLGLQVIGRIREQLDLDIPVQLLFENPELAPFVASATRSQLEQLADGEFGDMERELASLSEEELLAMLSEGVEND